MSLFGKITHGIENAGRAVSNEVKKGANAVSNTVVDAGNTATNATSNFASDSFNKVVKTSETEFRNATEEINNLLNSGEKALLKATATKKVKEYAHIIKALISAWPKVLISHSNDINILRTAASHKQPGNDHTRTAMSTIVTSQEMSGPVSDAASKSLASFAIEFGGNVAEGVGLEGAFGYAIGIPNVTDLAFYGTVGLSIGASIGGSVDAAIGLIPSSPKNSGGPYIAVVVEGDLDVGGGVVVSFNLPDFSFGGITIPLSAGEEINVSVGGGYTFIL